MRPFVREFESLGQYHDFWATVLLSAPDDFKLAFVKEPIDQKQALVDAFDTIRKEFRFVEDKIKDSHLLGVLWQLIEMSFEAYDKGDRKQGARALQECEGMIWPSKKIRPALVGEAEKRAFGEAIMFKDVVPPRYDHEGTEKDLGPGQQRLLSEALRRSQEYFAKRENFKSFALVLDGMGNLKEVKQRSYKKTIEEIKRLVAAKSVVASVITEPVLFGGDNGLLIHDLEEVGRPHVSVRMQVEKYQTRTARYHLEDPSIFELS